MSKNPSNVPFTCDATGNEVSGTQGSLLGSVVAPDKVSVFEGPTPQTAAAHGALIVSSGSETICENDVAFVVLDQPLALPTVPIRRAQPAVLGEGLTAVGYGTEQPDPTRPAPRTEREVQVTALGQWIRTFTVSEGPCEGDSGGPVLSPEGELAGVFSTVGVQCTGPKAAPKYTDLSFFSSLIERAFEAGGAGSPWPPADGAAGAAGVAGATAAADAGEAGQTSAIDGGGDARDAGGCVFGRSRETAPYLVLVLWAAVRKVGARRARATRRAQLAHESARLV